MARSAGNRSRLLLVLLLVSSLFLITLDLRGVNLAGSIRSGIATAFSPLESIASKIFSIVNLSLWRIKLEDPTPDGIRVFPKWVPVIGCLVSFGFVLSEVIGFFR